MRELQVSILNNHLKFRWHLFVNQKYAFRVISLSAKILLESTLQTFRQQSCRVDIL